MVSSHPNMPNTHDCTAVPAPCERTALLVFTRSVPTELSIRGWPRRFAPLLHSVRRSRQAVPGLDCHYFVEQTGSVSGESTGNIHPQEGCGFGERLRNAVETLAGGGYARIIMVGGDCPDLGEADILRAERLLREYDVVLGPDHRGGNYLIGIHSSDRDLLDAVVWRRDTDCEQLQSLFAGRRVSILPCKIDLDEWADLRLFAEVGGVLHRWLARQIAWLAFVTLRDGFEWIDLARQAETARRMTSPPLLV